MEMLLAPMDNHYNSKPMWQQPEPTTTTTAVRLPSLFVNTATHGGATSPLRSPAAPRPLGMSDVLNAQRQSTSAQVMITRLPSIGSIMRRDSSPCTSPKCDQRCMSPAQKQSCVEIYKQLKSPVSPAQARCSENALKNILASAALSQLSKMSPSASEYHEMDGDDASDKHKRSNSAKLCGMQECKKRAKAGGYCIAHGGGLRCSEDGCQKHAVSLGLCISHGGGKRCTVDGCLNASRKNGVCWSHGGKRLCKLEGCNKGPKSGGYCWSHGGKMKK